jgi:hypothetical protein
MTQIDAFLVLVDAFRKATDLSDTTLSSRVFDDSKKIAALRAGRDIQVRRLEAAVRWLAEHWPKEAEWPAAIAHPDLTETPPAKRRAAEYPDEDEDGAA